MKVSQVTIQLWNFSSKTSATHPRVKCVKGITTELFLQIFFNLVIYKSFPGMLLCISTQDVISQLNHKEAKQSMASTYQYSQLP